MLKESRAKEGGGRTRAHTPRAAACRWPPRRVLRAAAKLQRSKSAKCERLRLRAGLIGAPDRRPPLFSLHRTPTGSLHATPNQTPGAPLPLRGSNKS